MRRSLGLLMVAMAKVFSVATSCEIPITIVSKSDVVTELFSVRVGEFSVTRKVWVSFNRSAQLSGTGRVFWLGVRGTGVDGCEISFIAPPLTDGDISFIAPPLTDGGTGLTDAGTERTDAGTELADVCTDGHPAFIYEISFAAAEPGPTRSGPLLLNLPDLALGDNVWYLSTQEYVFFDCGEAKATNCSKTMQVTIRGRAQAGMELRLRMQVYTYATANPLQTAPPGDAEILLLVSE